MNGGNFTTRDEGKSASLAPTFIVKKSLFISILLFRDVQNSIYRSNKPSY